MQIRYSVDSTKIYLSAYLIKYPNWISFLMKLLHPNFRTLHTVLEVPSDSPPHMIISLLSIGFRREYTVRKGKEDYEIGFRIIGHTVGVPLPTDSSLTTSKPCER